MRPRILDIPRLRVWHLLGLVAAIAAYLAVFRLRDEENNPTLRTFREARSGDVAARREAVGNLGSFEPGQPDPIPTLLAALDDEDTWVRRYAIRGLRLILRGSSREEPVDPRVQQARIRIAPLLEDPDSRVQGESAAALVDLNDRSQPVLDVLLKLATGVPGVDAPTRTQALDLLASSFRSNERTPALLAAAMSDPDPKIREAATNSLRMWIPMGAEVIPDAVFEALMVGLVDEVRAVSELSALALSRMGPQARPAARVCIRLLGHSDPKRRMSAANQLSNLKIDAAPALPALRKLIDEDPDASVRSQAQYSVREIENALQNFREYSMPELIAELGENDPVRRRRAAQELGEYGAAAAPAVSALRRLRSDSSSQVRSAAETALRQIESQ